MKYALDAGSLVKYKLNIPEDRVTRSYTSGDKLKLCWLSS